MFEVEYSNHDQNARKNKLKPKLEIGKYRELSAKGGSASGGEILS